MQVLDPGVAVARVSIIPITYYIKYCGCGSGLVIIIIIIIIIIIYRRGLGWVQALDPGGRPGGGTRTTGGDNDQIANLFAVYALFIYV